MTKRQKLQIEQSEKRQRLNELLAIDGAELTDEQRAEMETLTKRMQQIEVEMRAAIVAEGEEESRAAAAFEPAPPSRAQATGTSPLGARPGAIR